MNPVDTESERYTDNDKALATFKTAYITVCVCAIIVNPWLGVPFAVPGISIWAQNKYKKYRAEA